MRKHNGMRPQDVPVLLKIIAKGENSWQNKDLASELYISPSEISESLNRSLVAGLINIEKRKVHRQSLLEFIEYGLHYTFPAVPGAIVNGLPTAHSHPFLKKHFDTSVTYVWPDVIGEYRGQAIEPLFKNAVKASLQDETFYKLLALADVLRVGKTREIKLAKEELKKSFVYEPQ
jgi:hypothetical protein